MVNKIEDEESKDINIDVYEAGMEAYYVPEISIKRQNHNRVVKGGPFTYWFDKYPAYCHYLVSVIIYVFKGDVGWLDQKY